jgi:tRNA pseudouridine55 synthase
MGGRVRYRDAVTLDEIERARENPEIDQLLHPVSLGLSDLPELRATAEGAARLKNGNPGHVFRATSNTAISPGPPSMGSPSRLAGSARASLHPERVFNL